MTTFPGSPKTQKGAIIGLDPFNPLASVIVFQQNALVSARCPMKSIEIHEELR